MDARLQRIRLTPAQLTARRAAAARPRVDGVKFVNFADFGTLGGVDREDRISCSGTTPPICNVNPAIKDDYALRAAAGISIGWKVPGLGPIQLDFSRVLAKQPYDVTETFRFSTSTRF